MQTEERQVTVTGSGETLQRAFQDALNSMRKQLLKGKPEALMQAEPVEVTVLKTVRHSWKEKFFGLLFERERENFIMTIRFTVEVSFVDLTTLTITEVTERPRVTQRILQMR
ncbi:MAG: DUF4312 family protein [Arachnia sp.]